MSFEAYKDPEKKYRVDARFIAKEEMESFSHSTFWCPTPECNAEMTFNSGNSGCRPHFVSRNVASHKEFCAVPFMRSPVEIEQMDFGKFCAAIRNLMLNNKPQKRSKGNGKGNGNGDGDGNSAPPKTSVSLRDLYGMLKQSPITDEVGQGLKVHEALLDMRSLDYFYDGKEIRNFLFIVEAQLNRMFYNRGKEPTPEERKEIMRDTTGKSEKKYWSALFLHVGTDEKMVEITVRFSLRNKDLFNKVLSELWGVSKDGAPKKKPDRTFVVVSGAWHLTEQGGYETTVRSDKQILVLKR